MGFAGQLFAARVAIGLAIPSPQALSKAGQQLATGIAGMMNAIDRAKERGSLGAGLQQDFDKITSVSKSALDEMNAHIVVKTKESQMQIAEIAKLSSESVEANFGKHTKAMERLRGASGKAGERIFGSGGMDSHGQFMMNMQKNLGATLDNVLYKNQAITRELQKQKDALVAQQATTTDMDELDTLGKKAEGLQELIDEHVELGKYLKENGDDLAMMSGEYHNATKAHEEFATRIVQTGQDIKNKVNENIRTTISLLTVLGYKLNQNTQELIEFERELLNANSVFNLTNDNLFEVGNTITEFSNRFGIAVQNGATGLYQLASAGVSANEALSILPETLKLSMAVQGDHNTISKLTAQTLFGFDMEMNQAAQVTDKFAFAIQKSLIEYQDLSSAVKFALPFFTSTGQSLDQLLGALQILTNRALEAGIAGRGLRQALAEFAESAMDAEAGFRKMGVEILNAEGEMLQLTEIASQFAQAVGPETASNTELLTTLIEELNVRGATAFIHLVQASDEFTQAVQDTENAGGQLDEMVRIQNESLSAQIQILKTNVFSIFAFRDAAYEGTEYLNQFHEAIVESVQSFKDLIVVEEKGEQRLTQFGMKLQKFATDSVVVIIDLIQQFLQGVVRLTEAGFDLKYILDTLTIPLRVIGHVFENYPNLTKFYLTWKAWNTILPATQIALWGVYAILAKVYGLMGGKMGGGGLLGAYALGGGPGAMGYMMAGGAMPFGMGKKGASKHLLPTKTWQDAIVKRSGVSPAGMHFTQWEDLVTGMKHGGKGKAIAYRKALFEGLEKGGKGVSMLPHFIPKFLGWLMQGAGKLGGKAGGGYISPMSGGGLAGAGSPYLVGEQGPELFVPTQGGQVLNTASSSNINSNMQFRNVTIGIDSFGGLS